MYKNARERAFLSFDGFWGMQQSEPARKGECGADVPVRHPRQQQKRAREGLVFVCRRKGRERILPVTDCRDI